MKDPKYKICPLSFVKSRPTPNDPSYDTPVFTTCHEEQCQWWDGHNCCIVSLTSRLTALPSIAHVGGLLKGELERDEADKEWHELFIQGKKIQAIKKHREFYNTGLKEAKDAVEEWAYSCGWRTCQFCYETYNINAGTADHICKENSNYT